jgi:hypothetical protein
MVIVGLKDLDPIAYIRYTIVYLGLDNLHSVRTEIDKLLAEQQSRSVSVMAKSAARGSPKSFRLASRSRRTCDAVAGHPPAHSVTPSKP